MSDVKRLTDTIKNRRIKIMTLSQLTEMLGWASIINIGVLMLSALMLIGLRSTILPIHSKMFGLREDVLLKIYIQFIAGYKVLTFIFIISPYLALKIMGQ